MKVLGGLWLIFSGRFFLIASSVVSLRIATEILGPTQAGIMNIILSITSMATLCIAPVGIYYNRHAIEWYSEGKLIKHTGRFILFLLSTAFLACFSLLTVHYAFPGLKFPISASWLLVILMGTLIITTLNGALLNIINLLTYRGYYVAFSNIAAWIGLLIATGVTVKLGGRAEFWLMGLFGGQGISLFLSIILLLILIKSSTPKIPEAFPAAQFSLISVFRFSWPLALCTALYWIQKDSYRLIMANLVGMDIVGIFTINFGIGMMLMASFETLFREYYDPIYYQAISHSSYESKIAAWNNYASAKFPAIILLMIFIIEGREFLSHILVSTEFRSGNWVIIWGTITYAFLMFYSTYLNLTFALLDNKAIIRPNLLGAISVLVLMYLLTPSSPLLGTAVALTMAMVITMLDTAYRLWKKHSIKLPWRRMVLSTISGFPLIIALELTKQNWPNATLMESIIILAITGIYFTGAQYLLAYSWLTRELSINTAAVINNGA